MCALAVPTAVTFQSHTKSVYFFRLPSLASLFVAQTGKKLSICIEIFGHYYLIDARNVARLKSVFKGLYPAGVGLARIPKHARMLKKLVTLDYLLKIEKAQTFIDFVYY